MLSGNFFPLGHRVELHKSDFFVSLVFEVVALSRRVSRLVELHKSVFSASPGAVYVLFVRAE